MHTTRQTSLTPKGDFILYLKIINVIKVVRFILNFSTTINPRQFIIGNLMKGCMLSCGTWNLRKVITFQRRLEYRKTVAVLNHVHTHGKWTLPKPLAFSCLLKTWVLEASLNFLNKTAKKMKLLMLSNGYKTIIEMKYNQNMTNIPNENS